jgi:hypothetical protein
MTTANLYKKHLNGEISKSKFLQEVRKDDNLPWITNVTSYEDAINILKNKRIISEVQLTVDQKIDRLNPYIYKHALNKEIEKANVKDDVAFEKAKNRVVNRLMKDINKNRYEMFDGSDKVKKQDKKLEMVKVKGASNKDEANAMKKVKGQEIPKANTKASKKENKKGKPKGVKEMTTNAKKAKGIVKVMEKPGKPKIVKESVLEALISLSKKKSSNILTEDTHEEFSLGQNVHLPQKDREQFSVSNGIVKGIRGGTITIELPIHDENNKPIEITRQVNVLKHAKKESNEQNNKNESVLEKHTNKNGIEFQVGEKAKDPKGNEITVRGFKTEDGAVYALTGTNSMYNSVKIDDLVKPGDEAPISDKEYRDKAFGKLPNYNAGQGWLSQQVTKKESKLDKVVGKLKEFIKNKKKDEVEEAVDVVTGTEPDGDEVSITTLPSGQGVKKVAQLKKQGVKSATSKTVV